MHFSITKVKLTPKKMWLSLHVLLLIITCASASQRHHKVRHKHNLLSLRGRHVNEIREAFDEYRNSLHKSSNSDEDIDNNLDFSEEIFKKLLSSTTEKPRKVYAPPVQFFTRNKRVFTTTTTQRSTDDDEDEYFENENDTANRRPNDDAQVRFNRDSSYSENQLAEGESLTDYKWKTLGTADGVGNSFLLAQAREPKGKDDKRLHHVNRNIDHLRIHGMCRWPSKKIVSMPRTPSKVYNPLSYVIHQCSDETACCTNPEKTCVAKKFKEIELWFSVQHMPPMRGSFESIKVINHTECDCVYKNQATMVRTTRVPMPWTWTTTRAPMCKCPSFFAVEVDEDGVCGCVCNNDNCKQLQEGTEGFTLSDRRRIQSGEVVQPHCLHGTYLEQLGRCPDKNEKISKGFQTPRTRRRSR